MLLYLIVPLEGGSILSATAMIVGLSVLSYVNSRFLEIIFLSLLKYLATYFRTSTLIVFLGIIGVFIHLLLIKFAGFENVYETLKRAAEASKMVQYFWLFYGVLLLKN
jgi:hypothetical protein